MVETPETLQGICVASVCCAIALALVIVTCDCFCKERKAAKELHDSKAYKASGGIEGQSNFVDGNNEDENVEDVHDPLMTLN